MHIPGHRVSATTPDAEEQELRALRAGRMSLMERVGAAFIEPIEKSVIGTAVLEGFGVPVEKPAVQRIDEHGPIFDAFQAVVALPTIPGRLVAAPIEHALGRESGLVRMVSDLLVNPTSSAKVGINKATQRGAPIFGVGREALRELARVTRSLRFKPGRVSKEEAEAVLSTFRAREMRRTLEEMIAAAKAQKR